jgi:hypothetical protein
VESSWATLPMRLLLCDENVERRTGPRMIRDRHIAMKGLNVSWRWKVISRPEGVKMKREGGNRNMEGGPLMANPLHPWFRAHHYAHLYEHLHLCNIVHAMGSGFGKAGVARIDVAKRRLSMRFFLIPGGGWLLPFQVLLLDNVARLDQAALIIDG